MAQVSRKHPRNMTTEELRAWLQKKYPYFYKTFLATLEENPDTLRWIHDNLIK